MTLASPFMARAPGLGRDSATKSRLILMWSNAPFKRPVAHAAGHATRIRGLSFEGPDAPLDDFHALFDDLDMRVGNRAGLRAGRARQRFIHDAADRSRAAATLRAAPE